MKDRIKTLRKALHLNQSDFGAKVGVKGNTIGNYEIGLRNPSDAVIFSICREFDVNEQWLRTGEGEMFNQSVESTVDRLCAELHASELESGIIRAYFRIDPRIREPFIQRMIQEMQSEYAALMPVPVDSVQPVGQKTPAPVTESGPKNANEKSFMQDVRAMNPGPQEQLFDQYDQMRTPRGQQKDASSASVPPAADDKVPKSEIPDQS